MTLQVRSISGSVSAKLQVRSISGTVNGGQATLQVRSIGGQTGSDGGTSGVVIAPIAGQSVHAFDIVTLAAGTASGSAPVSSWRFTLITDQTVRTLTLSGSGNSRTFVAPGRFNGCTVRIRIEALLSDGTVATSTVATVSVAAHADYVRVNGRWVAISSPRPVKSPVAPLTRSGSTIQANGQALRLSGANAYWLGLDDNAGTSSGSFPSHATITAALEGARDMGVNLVRAHTVGISAGTPNSFETAPGTFVGSNLDAADWAVAEAKRLGIYFVVPLTDNWNYYHGGKGVFVNWAAQAGGSGAPSALPAPSHLFDGNGAEKDASAERQFFYNANTIALFKAYVSAWLGHTNPYTGLTYGADPTIAIIETGNELYYAAQTSENPGWTQDIASYVKGIAPAKLLMDGAGADRQAVSTQQGLTAAAIDIVGAHYYPQQQSGSYPPVGFTATGAGYQNGNTAIQQIATDAAAAANAGKAFIVGEYPWTRSDVASMYSALETTAGIDGDLFWSLIGGTELHGGSFGSDDFPVHRPYLGSQEQQYAPALARHIAAVTGRTLRNGAG